MTSIDKTTKVMLIILAALTLYSFIAPFASAAPPVLSLTQAGSLEIIAPTYEYVSANIDKDIYWHVYNTSRLLTNTTTSCSYHLYEQKSKGEHIVTVNNVATYTNGRDFEVEVEGANFTIGNYCHLIECNTSTQTGALERCFKVTATGQDSTSSDFKPLIMALFGVIIILLISAFALAENHGILSALFAGIGFYLLVPLLNVANIALENSYLDAGISGMIGVATTILTWMDYALIVYIIVYVFVKVISGYNQDKQARIEGLTG